MERVRGRFRFGLVAVAALLAMVAQVAGAAAQGAPPGDRRAEWCPEPEARAFDFWLGEWDVDNRASPPGSDRWYVVGTATNRVYTVVGGCAVVEHWRGYAFASAGHIVGFSVRAWDPTAEKWQLVLLWPVNGPPRFGNPSGVFADGRGDFFNRFPGPDGDTTVSRLTFRDIEDDAFVWNNAISRDNGVTWDSSWIMLQTRRPPGAPGVWNEASQTTDRCPEPEHRTFDRWLGNWDGFRVVEGDTVATTTQMIRILEGCAVLERSYADDGSWARFRVRAYEPADSQWVEYSVASDRRTLHRREARTAEGWITFTDVAPVDGAFHRTRWNAGAEGIHRVEEASSSPDGPWRTVWEARFPARVSGRAGPPNGRQARGPGLLRSQ